MQDVVRQLVGFGLVAGHVMNLKGSQREATHGEMLHAPSMHAHVWAMLTSGKLHFFSEIFLEMQIFLDNLKFFVSIFLENEKVILENAIWIF
jgi:hypothetical protein